MTEVSQAVCAQEVPSIAEGPEDSTRWPFLQTALFVVVSSSLLWVLIIAVVRWLAA